MSVAAPAPRTTAAPRQRTTTRQRPRPVAQRTRAHRRRALSGAMLWIGLLAVLFGGIVALNVAALRGTIEAGKLSAETAALRSQNADLSATVASESSFWRVTTRARRLGMGPSQPGQGSFLRLTPRQQTAGAKQIGKAGGAPHVNRTTPPPSRVSGP